MDEQFEPLADDEVLFVNAGRVLMANPTFKVGEFIDALAQAISDREADWADENEGWFGEGLECEALRFSTRGWQRGRVRIRLEFCPDNREPKLLDAAPRRIPESRRPDRTSSRYEDVYRPEKDQPRFDGMPGREDYEE
jgi:hypothetical protein